MSYCKRSGTWLPAKDMIKAKNSNGEYELINPRKVSYWRCDECGECFIREECSFNAAYKNGDRVAICDDCADEYYYSCADCDELYYGEDITYYESIDRNICDNCRDEYYEFCYHCDEIHPRDDMYECENGHYICDYCTSEYNRCESCNRYITSDNFYYADDDEYEEYPYCRECAEREGILEHQNIHNYGYKPETKFLKISNEKKTNEYFGFEIEVSGESKYANEFLEAVGDTDENELYLKQDSSVIPGFEIVTHAMTRRYFKSKFMPKLTEGMRFLKSKGFRGHNKAGIHIHVSTEAISQDQFKKLMLLLYPEQDSIYKKWLAITQRHDNTMSRWSEMKMRDCYGSVNTRNSKKSLNKIIEDRKKYGNDNKPLLSDRRYTAINTQNQHTVEFRIFNSNIRPERIIKNAQVIFSLLDFTKTDKMPTFNNYMRFIEDNSETYKELWDFLLEKNIYQPRTEKEQLKKMLKTANEIDASVSNYSEMLELLRKIEPKQVTGIDDNDEVEGGTPCVSQF